MIPPPRDLIRLTDVEPVPLGAIGLPADPPQFSGAPTMPAPPARQRQGLPIPLAIGGGIAAVLVSCLAGVGIGAAGGEGTAAKSTSATPTPEVRTVTETMTAAAPAPATSTVTVTAAPPAGTALLPVLARPSRRAPTRSASTSSRNVPSGRRWNRLLPVDHQVRQQRIGHHREPLRSRQPDGHPHGRPGLHLRRVRYLVEDQVAMPDGRLPGARGGDRGCDQDGARHPDTGETRAVFAEADPDRDGNCRHLPQRPHEVAVQKSRPRSTELGAPPP